MAHAQFPSQLRLFGGAIIEGPDGVLTGRAARRHPLALTARLATAPNHALGREVLMALLWPESDSNAARRLLNVAVYDLRKSLGADVLRTEGGDLRLDVDVLRPDVVEFDALLARGALERAVALYAGPFLAGFHLSHVELEEWAEIARERYDRRYRSALERLARTAEEAGDLPAAERWWSRLRAEDQSNIRVTAHLMQVLEAAGARGRALQLADEHARVLRDEYGADPDPRIESLAREMRTVPGPLPPLEPFEPQPIRPHRSSDGESHDGQPPPGPEQPAPEQQAIDRVRSEVLRRSWWPTFRRPWGRVAAGAIPAVAVVATIGVMARWGGEPAAIPETSADRIMVLPFTVRGEETLAYLGREMVDLLSARLHVPGRVHTVDPIAFLTHVEGLEDGSAVDERALADRFAANAYVRGSIEQSGDGFSIRASLHDVEGRRRGEAAIRIRQDEEILDALDRLAHDLLSDHFSEGRDPLTSAAVLTTRSLAALKAFLEGEGAFGTGRFETAAEAFARAAAADSTFALAHYRLSLANLWADRPQTQPFDIDERALRYRMPLPEHSRLLVEAYVEWRRGGADAAERLYRRVLAAHPADVEAWHQLGETLFHYNPLRGRSILEAREPFERTLRLQPDHWGALWHLASLAAVEARTAELERILARLMELGPSPTKALEIRALQAFLHGSPSEVERLVPELRRADETVLASVATKVGVYLRDLEGAARVARLLVEPHRSRRQRAIGFTLLAGLEMARGRPSAARAHLAALDGVDDVRMATMEERAFLSLVPFMERPAHEVTVLRQMVDRWETRSPDGDLPVPDARSLRLYLLGLLSAASDDSAAAIQRAQELERAGDPVDRGRAGAIRGELLRREGRPAEALAVLRESWQLEWFGWAVSGAAASKARERYARAELTQQAGRLEEALRWFATFGEHGLHDLVYLAPAHLRRAQIYERMGRPSDAAREYARFLSLWRESDPELRPLVDDARQRIARLKPISKSTGRGDR